MEKCNDCKKMVEQAPFGQCDDCFEQEKHKKKMLEDFDFFTKAENMKDFFNALQIKELKKYAHFVF